MPRRAQNPNHVLTRLRRQLSTPDHDFTREDLSAKTGIPLGSVKAIESGKYGLTNELVFKISVAVGANPYDLSRGANPLRDCSGRPLSAESKRLEELKAPYLSERPGFETDQFLAKTIFEAAEKKLIAMQFRFLFREALASTAQLLGLESAVAEELSKHLGEFDPNQVPPQFLPSQGEAAAKWETFKRLVQMEDDRIWMERRGQGQDPLSRITPEMSAEEKQHLRWESARFEAEIHAEALANVSKKAADLR